MTDSATLLPPEYGQAAANFKTMLSGTPLPPDAQGKQSLPTDLQVEVSKGFELGTWRDGAGNDSLQITIKSPSLVSSETADAIGKAALAKLNDIEAVRNNAIVVTPAAYTSQVKNELGVLLQEAKNAHVQGKHIDLRDIDLTKWSGFDSKFSLNQIPDHAVQLIESPIMTQIRVNIPTNPDHREEAMATADKVARVLRTRLPQIKEGMIKRILEKNYNPRAGTDAKYREDWTKQMEAHQFEIATQQQGNWTSVFINISSPEQVAAKANPTAPVDPFLQNNNLLSVIDEKHRFKLAARSTLFEGEGLKKPSEIFTDVAGSKDMENIVGKAMHYLVKAKPELAPRAEALLKENLFKRTEQWNLPPEQQEEHKHGVRAGISPDHPDTMKITLTLPKGKADEIVQAIAGLSQSTAPAKANDGGLDAVATSIVNAGAGLEQWATRMGARKEAAKGAGLSLAT